jgi:FKBP-type peptidyl-prolyl cis-trans isomerase (trigger factor)
MISKTTPFVQNPDKTFIINITFEKAEISITYNKVINSAQSNFNHKGFRKGKVPLDIVKENLSESRIIEEILTSLVTDKYRQIVTEKHLHPIIQPQIRIVNPPLDLNKEWQIEITGCELPEISIDFNYESEIKKINTAAKNDNDRLNQTIGCLIKHSQVNLPELLINNDVNNKLSQLIDQTKDAGITVNDYLKSKNLTLEKYQTDLRTQITQEWTTNLAIDSIAKAHHLTVSEKEADEVISKNKDLAKNLNLVYYLLTQQKVFDYLKNL